MKPGSKLLVDFGPLVLFFLANARFGIYAATGVFMAAVLAAMGVSYALERRISPMTLVTTVVVAVFGSLTLYLQDERFIKVKPTIINFAFAAALLAGLARGRNWLHPLLGSVLQLTEEGWRILTLRWALFFAFLGGLNEVVWRHTTTDQWVTFKVFGLPILTLFFSFSQVPLIQRHAPANQDESDAG